MKGSRVAIRVEGLSVSYSNPNPFRRNPDKRVLENIALEVRSGETLGIIGRNGAGKSSLLKVLAGILAPNAGRVHRSCGRSILLSYQLGFNGKLTGRQNAIYSALLQGSSRAEIENKMPDIIEFSGLREAIDEPLSTYSSGMKSRLGFAVATQSDAEVIMIDEALGVGDRSFREKSARFIRDWVCSDRTVVFVSHDENSIRNLCDRVVWLEGGRVAAEGPVEDVLDYYEEYDHVIRNLATALNRTEADLRAEDPDPLGLISQMRRGLKEIWNEEDRMAAATGGMVKFFRPGRNIPFSHIGEEACGSWVWVENARQVCRGRRESVCVAYESYLKAVDQLSEKVGVSPRSLRESRMGRLMTESLSKVNEVD